VIFVAWTACSMLVAAALGGVAGGVPGCAAGVAVLLAPFALARPQSPRPARERTVVIR